MSRRTRKSTAHWLIGTGDNKLMGCKLPSTRQVLRLFLYEHFSLHKTTKESAKTAVRAATAFWERAHILTREEKNSTPLIEKVYNRWRNLKKRKSWEGTSPALDGKIKKFQDDLDSLFDIAPRNVFDLITIQEDKDFLIAQRKNGREACMTAVDKKLAKETARKEKLEEMRQRQKKREEEQKEKRFLAIRNEEKEAEVEPNRELEGNQATGIPDPDYRAAPGPSSSAKRVKVISSRYLDMVDRTKLSVRKAAAVGLTLAGKNAGSVVMSKSTLHRERVKHRSQYDEEESIQEMKNMKPIVISWDGKLLPDITGKSHVDRLPVLASSGNWEKLLGVPKILTGTGFHQAVAVTDLVNKYQLRSQAVGLNFDTTASNSGKENGACIQIERILKKILLWLACRHHVLEVVLGDVFRLCLGPSKGPICPLFERFRENWTSLDTTDFDYFDDESSVPPDERREIIRFCEHQLKVNQPRSDYKKLLFLTMAFLGAPFPDGQNFSAPGGLSDARWMAKANYCLAIYMFRKQLRLSKSQERRVLRVCLFVVRVYVKFWFTCQVATMAPRKDLELIKSLQKYAPVDKEVAETGSKAVGRHLWYLSEHLIALSFFDEEVSIETKRNMVKNMKEKQGRENPPRRIELSSELTIADIASRNLEDFVTTSTSKFFAIVGLSTEFLDVDPMEWEAQETFIEAKSVVTRLRVVNDGAERGVALIKEYTEAGLTKDETQLQFLPKIVKDHRQGLPKLVKAKVIAYMKTCPPGTTTSVPRRNDVATDGRN